MLPSGPFINKLPVAVTREQTPGGIIPNAGGGGPNNLSTIKTYIMYGKILNFWHWTFKQPPASPI